MIRGRANGTGEIGLRKAGGTVGHFNFLIEWGTRGGTKTMMVLGFRHYVRGLRSACSNISNSWQTCHGRKAPIARVKRVLDCLKIKYTK